MGLNGYENGKDPDAIMIQIHIAQFLFAESRVCGPDPGFPLGSDPDLNSGKNELEDMKTEYLSVRNHDPDPHHPIFIRRITCGRPFFA